MAKRKAEVNNIIYELDNEDINESDLSDDELNDRVSKVICTEKNKRIEDEINKGTNCVNNEIDDVKLLENDRANNILSDVSHNGGKTDAESFGNDLIGKNSMKNENKINGSLSNVSKINKDSETIIYNEDIDVDSTASNSDLGVVGCENRTPLVNVRFKDSKSAKVLKKQVKEFMIKLIKLHEEKFNSADSDTDVELDIWPEDLIDEVPEKPQASPSTDADNLFFIDIDPKNINVDIPVYDQASHLISNQVKQEDSSPQVLRRGPICFNCEGEHALRDCSLPRNNNKIAHNRRNAGVRLGRYHVEDEQKYGHLIPGRISGQLRYALGLKRYEIPMHVYKMRLLGYPPGWLEEARISHSGITMFDSTGAAILDPEEEEGEVNDPGSKDKFDIKKIVDFPGFNVPASSRYKEECHLYGFPPMSEQDSKMLMLQMLAPNAMKAYKRKKLTFFPSAAHNASQESQEMELDNGDEVPAFPSVPPLPDDEPLPPPPPPTCPPPESPKSKLDETGSQESMNKKDSSQDDVEVIEIMQVKDIPFPEDSVIIIDEDLSVIESGQCSPTIDDLEAKKQQLLDAIKISETSTDAGTDSELTQEVNFTEEITEVEMAVNHNDDENNKEVNKDDELIVKNTKEEEASTSELIFESKTTEGESSQSEVNKTPDAKTGLVKNTLYGTPVMNIASPYMKLPSDDKFAKDICDIIQFENLPNSIGKYKKISSLLKKVKNEVDRIQDS